ncbi:hypothetical protein D3C81_1763090 [compost metagenome]
MMMTAGLESGSGCSTWRIASVPPVDAPIAISFSELSNGTAFSVFGAAIGLCAARRARDAVRTFSAIISL